MKKLMLLVFFVIALISSAWGTCSTRTNTQCHGYVYPNETFSCNIVSGSVCAYSTFIACESNPNGSSVVTINTCGNIEPFIKCVEGNTECPADEFYHRNYIRTICTITECSTQAEIDSVKCVDKPGFAWQSGTCIAPSCQSNCQSKIDDCVGNNGTWIDSVTYTVDAETGDTTFVCAGYCKEYSIVSHSDSSVAMDDSLSIVYRKNYADSIKIKPLDNCVAGTIDTTAKGFPEYLNTKYFVEFAGHESQIDTAAIGMIDDLYNQSCTRELYRGIKNGRYVFWYSPDEIPEGVTNVIKIK